MGNPRRKLEKSAIGEDAAVLQIEKGPGTALVGREERFIEDIGHSVLHHGLMSIGAGYAPRRRLSRRAGPYRNDIPPGHCAIPFAGRISAPDYDQHTTRYFLG
jgi:hypothetical protein